MIDPISAFAALSAGHGAIMKGIQMGKDLSSLSNAVSRYAQGEAELQFGEARKKKARFSLAEDSAIEKHFRKEKLEDMRNELRSIFQLYGKAGQWERLQAEIANERARIKKELNVLLQGLFGVASSAVEGYMDTKKAKAKQKLVKNEAETSLMEKKIAGEIDWDKEAIAGSKESWKDEYLTILFSIPLLLCFIPFTVEYVERGFEALSLTPDWYRYTLGIIVSASFGIKGATKMFGKK